jgi:release factor glutamine methyltransferase
VNTLAIRHVLLDAQRTGLERLDAQMLLLLALGRNPNDRAWLLAHDDSLLTPDQATRYAQTCERRLRGEPLAYIAGHKEFFGLDLQVDARVLVPRPDTETLVQWALDTLEVTAAGTSRPLRVLDLGTGSGAIALAIQRSQPATDTWATDASADALAVARTNAMALGLPITFREGRWWNAVPGERFHLAVSNPPYIEPDDPHLQRLTHEPPSALVAGPDGLTDLRDLVLGAPSHLHPEGWLLVEHGHDQAGRVRALFRQAGFANVSTRNDIAGIERCTGGQWLEKP